jgi:two-component system, NarL family, sensor kinase
MSYIIKIIVFEVVLFFLQSYPVMAQQLNIDDFNNFQENKNHAIAELKKFAQQDTSRVNALIKVFTTATFLRQQEEVAPYRIEAMALSRKLHFVKGLAYCYSSTAIYYKSSLNNPSANIYFDSVLHIIGNSNDKELRSLKSKAYENKGKMYYVQENYYTALNYFFEALNYTEYDAGERIIRINIFITEIYTSLNNLEKATEYAKKNIVMAEKNGSIKVKDASVYFSFIDICLLKNDLQTAASYLDKMAKFIPNPEQVLLNKAYYQKRGEINYQQQKYSTALTYFQQAYKYAIIGGHKNSITNTLRFLSSTALKLGDTKAAKDYALQNLALAEEGNTKTAKIDALINLSNYYNTTGNSSKAFELSQQAMQLKDSLLAETNIKQINILGAIYETDKKEKEIIQLQNEKQKEAIVIKQKSNLNKIFIAAIAGLLVLGYLAYRNFRNGQQILKQQQSLQQQKITELEKDKQLLTVDAMLKAQEDERSRIAKDLHDGLGSMLSGAKLSFINMKDNMVLTQENILHFERSIAMLDNTIGELRKVAHNLMPEAVVKFGLDEALKDFCNTIQSSSKLTIIYQQFGEDRKLNSAAEVTIYRIVQELVNNALKYSGAKQIIVQLTKNHVKVGVAVEDDGKGFDIKLLDEKKGAGINNIKYRVNYFKGTFDIISSPGNGTSVNIELMA